MTHSFAQEKSKKRNVPIIQNHQKSSTVPFKFKPTACLTRITSVSILFAAAFKTEHEQQIYHSLDDPTRA